MRPERPPRLPICATHKRAGTAAHILLQYIIRYRDGPRLHEELQFLFRQKKREKAGAGTSIRIVVVVVNRLLAYRILLVAYYY